MELFRAEQRYHSVSLAKILLLASPKLPKCDNISSSFEPAKALVEAAATTPTVAIACASSSA